MARYIGPVCRLCRREGEKLFLKGERCFSKCTLDKRPIAPGQHGKSRQSTSDFKVQLRARQKTKRMYGMLEGAFRKIYELANKKKGVTGTEMLRLLEQRLDNIVHRLGFGGSRALARQLVRHGHILVNGKRVTIPSFSVSVGDAIEVAEKSKGFQVVRDSVVSAKSRIIPSWLSLDDVALKGSILSLPDREMLPQTISEQDIIEGYSR